MKKLFGIIKRIKPKLLRYFLVTIGLSFLVLFVFIASIYLGAWGKLPSSEELASFKYQEASEVFSADSVLIGKYYLNDRQPIPFDAIPDKVLHALIAIEDERFYDHSGIDYKSLFRVGLKTILMGDTSSGGGSTITQQLAKNLYPRKERNETNIVVDKFKEMLIAKRLETIFSKEEILAHYLNTVSFGDNTFGIESAALKFFNTRTKNLSYPQAATLVGMLKATYGYNPRIFPDKSLTRRNVVLAAMHRNGFIDKNELKASMDTKLALDYREFDYNAGLAPYFREEVRKQLIKWTEQENEKGGNLNLYTSGLKIYTTLNYKMQKLAEEVMARHMTQLQESFEKSYGKNAPWLKDKILMNKIVKRSSIFRKLKNQGFKESEIIDSLKNNTRKITFSSWQGDFEKDASTWDSIQYYSKILNTGTMSMDAHTGAVFTWIGGVDFKRFKYDHISQSKRQVGSTFKPIVYTAALEKGIAPCTYFSAQEIAYKNLEGWSPSNSGEKNETYLKYSMEQGLSNSVNTIAVKVLEKTGIGHVLEQAKKMGIKEKLPKLPSLALGTGEIRMTEMAKAYTSYLNEGKTIEPFIIKRITNQNDSILASFESKMNEKSAFSKENGAIMIEMMKATIDSGTASRIRDTYNLKNDIAGKTGTTQNNKDAWFVALTPKLIHLTWVGLDNHEIGFKNTSLGQGANAALPLFALWYQELNKDKAFTEITQAKFPQPSASVLTALDCEPIKRDGFFKRLFKNPNKKKEKKFKN